MELILLIFSVWGICKGIKSIVRLAPATSRKGKAATAANQSTSANKFAALTALQEQRDIIREQLSDIETQLDYCPPEKIRNQLMNRKTVLLGKLSTCEQRIARMCA